MTKENLIIAAVAFVAGIIVEWKYGAKIEAAVKSDVADLKTRVATIESKLPKI